MQYGYCVNCGQRIVIYENSIYLWVGGYLCDSCAIEQEEKCEN